jgi:DNA-binding transcriptional ArsR family regulator
MPRRNGAGIELLADPMRRRIAAALAVGPRRPSSLGAELGLSRPAISRQLGLLRDAGLVVSNRSRIDGRVRVYQLDHRNHGRVTAWLLGVDFRRPTSLKVDAGPGEVAPLADASA